MASVTTYGRTAKATLETMRTIRSKGKASILSRMAATTRDNGKEDRKAALERIADQTVSSTLATWRKT